MSEYKFKIESPDGIPCDSFNATPTRAQQLARFYSLLVDGEFCVFVRNPLITFGNPLKLGYWIKHGYAIEGVFFDA